MLQLWFDRVSKIVNEFGGEVDKYIGDCVMALWRGKEADAHSFTNNAAKAGIQAVEETNALAEHSKWPHQAKYPWQCRVSLNTGYAMFGSVGGRGSRNYTVLGDVVNVAFRLDRIGSKKGCQFLVSANTASHIKDSINLKSLGLTEIEGRKESIETFTLA